MIELTEDERRAMVDRRVCRILAALPARDPEADGDALIAEYLADEWACLEVAAAVVAPMYGLDGTDPDVCKRLQRAAHAAMEEMCRRLAAAGRKPG